LADSGILGKRGLLSGNTVNCGLKGLSHEIFDPLFFVISIFHMILRHCQNIIFFKNSFFQNYRHLKSKIFTSPANGSQRKWIFFLKDLTFYFDTFLGFDLSICPSFIFLNFSSFLILKNVFFKIWWTSAVNYHFPCEWFTAGVTSPANGSPRKWLPLQMVHPGSDFRCEWFTTEVSSAVNHSQGKWHFYPKNLQIFSKRIFWKKNIFCQLHRIMWKIN